MTIDPKITGRTIAAWFANVPYQATRPRSSRESVVPTSATQAAAVGPPRTAAAIRGAVDTATCTPWLTRTGRDDAIRAMTVQKIVLRRISARLVVVGSLSNEIAIAGCTGITRLV